MKNVFGFDISNKKDDYVEDGIIFVTKVINEELREVVDDSYKETKKFENKSQLPLALRIIKTICGFIALIFFVGVLRSGVSLKEGYQNAPYVYWIGSLALLIWVILFCISKKLYNTVIKNVEFQEHLDDLEEILTKKKEDLDIPEDAKNIDVFLERYAVKKGKIKQKNFTLAVYVNMEVAIYVKDNQLCLSDLEKVWSIPLASFKSIELQPKKASCLFWNKEEAPNSEKYKKYKIKTNSNNQVFTKYYKIDIEHELENFYLLIPIYDGDIFMDLVNIEPKKEEIIIEGKCS